MGSDCCAFVVVSAGGRSCEVSCCAYHKVEKIKTQITPRSLRRSEIIPRLFNPLVEMQSLRILPRSARSHVKMPSEDFWIYVQHPRWSRCGGGRFACAGRAFRCGRLVCFGDQTRFESLPIHFAKVKVTQTIDGGGKLRARSLESRSGGKAGTCALGALGQHFANGLQPRGNYKII